MVRFLICLAVKDFMNLKKITAIPYSILANVTTLPLILPKILYILDIIFLEKT